MVGLREGGRARREIKEFLDVSSCLSTDFFPPSSISSRNVCISCSWNVKGDPPVPCLRCR